MRAIKVAQPWPFSWYEPCRLACNKHCYSTWSVLYPHPRPPPSNIPIPISPVKLNTRPLISDVLLIMWKDGRVVNMKSSGTLPVNLPCLSGMQYLGLVFWASGDPSLSNNDKFACWSQVYNLLFADNSWMSHTSALISPFARCHVSWKIHSNFISHFMCMFNSSPFLSCCTSDCHVFIIAM